MEISDKVQFKRDLWKKSIPNIEKFMIRRHLIFQQMVNDGFFIFQHQDTDDISLLVFVFSEKMGIETLKYIIAFCESINIKNTIIIHQNLVTSNCKKVIESLFQYNIEIFELDHFQYDITKLYYYIPHEKIQNSDFLKKIREKYKNKLPILLRTDPICRYFGFKRNDIIKIERNKNEIIFRQVR